MSEVSEDVIKARREYHKRWRDKNRERLREEGRVRTAKWRAANPENRESSRAAARAWKKRNASAVKAYMNVWRSNNPEKHRAYAAASFARDPERILARNRRWRTNNPEKQRASKTLWMKNRRAQRRPDDLILWSLRRSLSFYLHKARTAKSRRVKELFGCSVAELKTHIEQKFRDGMTWENYGQHWQLDHIRPCASFDFLNIEHQRQCFHFLNLQPLLVEENRIKSDKYDGSNAT